MLFLKTVLLKWVALVNGNPKIRIASPYVEVTSRIRPIGLTKTFNQVQVAFKNLNDEFDLEDSYAAVDITVEGETLVLEKLSSASVFLSADCAPIENEGTYELSVSASLPKGVRLLSISADSITLNVVKKKSASDEEVSSETSATAAEEKVPAEEVYFDENINDEGL